MFQVNTNHGNPWQIAYYSAEHGKIQGNLLCIGLLLAVCTEICCQPETHTALHWSCSTLHLNQLVASANRFLRVLKGIPRILAKIEDVRNSWLLVISPTEKELTAGSNCCGKQRHGEIVKVKLSKIASLIDKKACSAFQNTEQGPISRKSLIINGPGKLPPFTLKIEVSIDLHLTW